MRVPDVGFSAERLHAVYGLYHLSRLRADTTMAELAMAFEQAQNALKKRMEEAVEVQMTAMTALAIRDARDDELDDAVRGFYFDLLSTVVNNRTDPTFLRYFPDGMTAVIGLPPVDEVRSVGILLAKLDEETDPELKQHAGPIRRAVGSLSEALEAYETAVDAARLASQTVQQEKLSWVDAYKLSYRELQRRFYKDAKKAERYFRSARRTTRAREQGAVEEVAEELDAAAEPIVADGPDDGGEWPRR